MPVQDGSEIHGPEAGAPSRDRGQRRGSPNRAAPGRWVPARIASLARPRKHPAQPPLSRRWLVHCPAPGPPRRRSLDGRPSNQASSRRSAPGTTSSDSSERASASGADHGSSETPGHPVFVGHTESRTRQKLAENSWQKQKRLAERLADHARRKTMPSSRTTAVKRRPVLRTKATPSLTQFLVQTWTRAGCIDGGSLPLA